MWAGMCYGFGMYAFDFTGFRFSKCYNLLITGISVSVKCMTMLVNN